MAKAKHWSVESTHDRQQQQQQQQQQVLPKVIWEERVAFAQQRR